MDINETKKEINYTLIIPAYNEGMVIAGVLKELGNPLGCAEIIVVDDGSTDNTAKIAVENGARVVCHQHNRGNGAAIKTGICSAETETVIVYDADGQHRPEDLEKIAKESPYCDMVVGARNKKSQKDWTRVPGKMVLGIFANILSGHKIPDLTSGLRSFKVSVIKKYLHLMPNGFSMATTSTIALFKMGHNVKYIPIMTKNRLGRKSSVKIFSDGFRVIMLILNLIVLFNPQRVFLPISVFFVSLGTGYFIVYSLVDRVHLTPSMLLLIITGIILFFMGIICEHISAIRRELHS
ncbi:glycosyltransferase family 2 protein [Candidatus Parcubacteria bacterium]|nr:glycosyltransferase family 2 protein [Candidatus Parcubacteria bacterium]